MNNLSGDFKSLDNQIGQNQKTQAVATIVAEKPKLSKVKIDKEIEKLKKSAMDLQESIDKLYEQHCVPELGGASIYTGLVIKTLKTLN